MKTSIKTGIASLLLFSAISCTKTIENAAPSSLPSTAKAASTESFTIGQSYGGGIIFYIDGSGEHGLIAATADQGSGIAWNNGSNIVTDATGTAVGDGKSNTNKIVNAQGKTGTYAAYLCYKYKTGEFKDWYLPSKDELNLLYQQKDAVGGLSGDYWSSSESSKARAWEQVLDGGFQFKYSKNFTLNVRAIRSF